MHIIVCLDNQNGMLFNGRRQSQDRAVTADILSLIQGQVLFLSPYSASLFHGKTGRAECISEEHFLEQAGMNDYCFVEEKELTPYLPMVRKIIVYRWNRSYPADVFFPLPLDSSDLHLSSHTEFPGHSHETITRDIYIRLKETP